MLDFIRVRDLAAALALERLKAAPSSPDVEADKLHDPERGGAVVRAVVLRIRDFRYGPWTDLVRENVWLVPSRGLVVVCQKGLRPEPIDAVQLAQLADTSKLGTALNAAHVEHDDRARRARLLPEGSVLVLSSRNGWRGYGTDPLTGYWGGRPVTHTAVRFADDVPSVVPLDSAFVTLVVEVVPDHAYEGSAPPPRDYAKEIETLQELQDDTPGTEVTYCYVCGRAIDPAWYGYKGYRRNDPPQQKVCDLCTADEALVPSGDSEEK